jgi:hypothetical protein
MLILNVLEYLKNVFKFAVFKLLIEIVGLWSEHKHDLSSLLAVSIFVELN